MNIRPPNSLPYIYPGVYGFVNLFSHSFIHVKFGAIYILQRGVFRSHAFVSSFGAELGDSIILSLFGFMQSIPI